MKIILTGGGTAGSVSPLLAVREALIERQIDAEFIWIGTETGVEKEMIAKEKIPFYSIKSGKLRRYFDWQNFLDPWRIIQGVVQAYKIIKAFQPDIILSAGGFVCVPVIFAGRLLKCKSIIHQQDIKAGLANLLMVKFATKITVAFKSSLVNFPLSKTVLIGNPIRLSLLRGNRERARIFFDLEEKLPILLVVGGSLGAAYLNQLLADSVRRLFDVCQIIHIVGKGNLTNLLDEGVYGAKAKRYHQFEYLYDEMADALTVADLVVCRAGLSTLTEVSALRKATVIIPIPGHQQEINARYFQKKNAALVLNQNTTASDQFVSLIREIIRNPKTLNQLSENIAKMFPEDSNNLYVNLILDLLEEN